MHPDHQRSTEDRRLRERAEERLRAEASPTTGIDDPLRVLHELQVHQIQLEMQNEELREARTRLEDLLGKYTDLYDFAPVGYFSLDASGRIDEVNLPGATMLGIERSNLLRRRFSSFVARSYQPCFDSFFSHVLKDPQKQACELVIDEGDNESAWVDLQATRTVSTVDGSLGCRLAMSDITARKNAAEAQLRVAALEARNIVLYHEIARRKRVEQSLMESRQSKDLLLAKSTRMEEELRMLSHQILHTQEEERKRISHDLHDEIAQTLVAINVHLAQLVRGASLTPKEFAEKILETQQLVANSVESVHRFAMGLRPTGLDAFGFLSALKSYIVEFTQRTNLPVKLTGPSRLEHIEDKPSVVLFRVAQAALSNVAQHAHANQVKIHIRQTQRTVRMDIDDDGASFNVEETLNGSKIKRLGLIGMRERVEMVGGKFSITSTPGRGTTICVILPHLKTKSFVTPPSESSP